MFSVYYVDFTDLTFDIAFRPQERFVSSATVPLAQAIATLVEPLRVLLDVAGPVGAARRTIREEFDSRLNEFFLSFVETL